MKGKSTYTIVSLLIVQTLLCLCTSCETMDSNIDKAGEDKGVFLTTSGTTQPNGNSRSAVNTDTKCNGSMTAQIDVSDWGNVPFSSRSTVTGDEVQWRNATELSVYLTDATTSDNTLIARNLAMNPISHIMYETYHGGTTLDGGKGQTISATSFFWDSEWGGKDKMTDKVNFYGFYPRPSNSVYQGALTYIKSSIILTQDAEGSSGEPWNKLHYAFVDQTDENMTWHDVMCSIPEDEGTRYGNRKKVKGNNVQLHYKHMFSLLDIEIDRGDKYIGDCTISSLVLSGTQVYTEGTLDIENCTISPTRGSGDQDVKIARIFDAQQITKDSPFHTTMIVQPTQDGDAPNSNGRLVLTCCIDGVNYSCDFPTLKLDAGKKYHLKLTLTPAGIIVFKIWDGATVTIGNDNLDSKDSETEISTQAEKFAVSTEAGYHIVDILKNGQSIFKEGQTEYNLDKSENNNTNYNIVACKDDNWYITDGLQLHYDGIRNQYNGGGTQQKDIGVWYDLSGHGNDGTLRSFTSNSGWNGDGLTFDGLDDIVYYSGKITPSYSMEFYICVESEQRGAHPRFVAEGDEYPCFYFYGTSQKYDGSYTENHNTRTIAFYNHQNRSLGTNIVTDGKSIIQLDFTYDSDEQILKWFVNGVLKGTRESNQIPKSIDIASIGNRYIDNSRAMAATYYSFMIYDKALTEDEITQNYNVNVTRYGKDKQ